MINFPMDMPLRQDTYRLEFLSTDAKGNTYLKCYIFHQDRNGNARKVLRDQGNPDNDSEELRRTIYFRNKEECNSAVQQYELNKKELKELPDSPKLLLYNTFVQDVIAYFKKWFRENNYKWSPKEVPQPQPMHIYQEYEELFFQFLEDPNSDPDEVKRILNDSIRWSNPSQLLANARRKARLTVRELKSKSGFTWIDPKGTAKD